MARLPATRFRPLVPAAGSTKKHCWRVPGLLREGVGGSGLRSLHRRALVPRPRALPPPPSLPIAVTHAAVLLEIRGLSATSQFLSASGQNLAATRTRRVGKVERKTRTRVKPLGPKRPCLGILFHHLSRHPVGQGGRREEGRNNSCIFHTCVLI